MRNDEPEALDRALDRALGQYSNVEPLAGLEQRVLNRVLSRERKRAPFARWALAVGVAVVAIIGAAVWRMRPAPHAVVAGQARRPVVLAAQRRVAPRRLKTRPGPARRTVRLSPEERALLTPAAQGALLDLQQRGAEPIQVEEIRIEPIRNTDAKDDAKDDTK
jgi:hypothetical protein